MLLAKLLPAFDEPVGALERVDADFRFDLHRADSLMAAPLCCLADQFRIIAECAVEVGGALGPDRVQSIAGAVQRPALVGHRVDTLRAGLPDRVQRLGLTLDRAAPAPGSDRLRAILALRRSARRRV